MMTEQKTAIQAVLGRCRSQTLSHNAADLFRVLGYNSDRAVETGGDPAAFFELFQPGERFNPDKALREEWRAVDILFQLTGDDIRRSEQLQIFDRDARKVDNTIIESYLFLAVDLRGGAYTRTQLAGATREINKLFPMPAFVLFRHGETLTLSVINRRLHKRNASQDVLEKVTLIKDIRAANPHRAHIEILHDLSLDRLATVHGVTNFVELYRAWQKTLDSSELNKRFFREVADWYFWAVDNVVFPPGAGPDETRNPTSVIRLLTRLIFVWFLKEKGLVPEELFSRRKLDSLLKWGDRQGSTYYKAILQNLFFATLNQEMGEKRRFRGRGNSRDSHYGIHNVYRYEDYFSDPERALQLFATIPFLNGGLFECLDRPSESIRIDGFSDRADNPLRAPDELFFGEERVVDLNAVYDTTAKRYTVRGLIDILNRYKFTIDENTPIEEEIALDPELLGRVFENLLAAYNPETGTTARKATGSFYTPREIVNYMVDEALLAYLSSQTSEVSETSEVSAETRRRDLLAYNDAPHDFRPAEVERLIAAIDYVNILDPACGSGAFPMGILHKLVYVLGKLDPGNERWKQRQLEKAAAIEDPDIRRQSLAAVEQTFTRNRLDYGRKLYLIENCIYGVDIQPIAVQIAKLRFFISLVVDQRIDDNAPNRGILPLPNLETKFVAANTLLGISKAKDEFSGVTVGLRSGEVVRMEKELETVRHRYFTARAPETKRKYRVRDKELRDAIAEALRSTGLGDETVRQLASWDPYDQNAHAEFFDPEWMFGLTDGFDIVIGNPPYVRQEKIRDLKPALKLQYKCYTGTADLYVYFFERGYTLLRPGGALVYISSNKYFRAGYGGKLRALLGRQTTIRQLIDFGDAPVFTAIAYPSIIVMTRDAPGDNRLRALNWEPGPPVSEFVEVFARRQFAMPQAALGADGWRLDGADALALLDKLRRAGTPLGEYVGGRFYIGIKTAFNEAYIVDRTGRDRLIAEDPRSADLLKPFLRGRDVKRWNVNFAERYLIKIESSTNRHHPWSGKTPEQAEKSFAKLYPAIFNHLNRFHKELISRSDKGQYYWELRNCVYWEELDLPKIIWPDIAQRSEFALDPSGNIIDMTLFAIISNDVLLLGILNSILAEWWVRTTASSVQNNFLRFKRIYLESFRIPEGNEAIKDSIRTVVTAIQNEPGSIKKEVLEKRLNELVYNFYNLTPTEIALIEGQTANLPDGAPTPPDLDEEGGDDADTATPAAVPLPAHKSEYAAAPAAPLIFTGVAPTGSSSERKAAVERLANDNSAGASQHLAAALADDSATVRWLAAAHLKRLGRAALPAVRAYLACSDSPVGRKEAEAVLAYIETD